MRHADRKAGVHYEPAVDGLRALAVIAVVLYHSGLGLFHGGFTGVDAFFVVSGYVITKLIVRERAAGTFRWAEFYRRRALRLLPALAVTLVLTMAVASQILSPLGPLQGEYKAAIAAAVMAANLYFWRHSGSYFESSVESSPLLHLWSLGIEEQFYLAIPLLWLAHGLFPRLSIRTLLVAAALTSAGLALWGAAYHPTAAFYLPVTRIWQFAMGAAVVAAQRSATTPRRLAGSRASLAALLLASVGFWVALVSPWAERWWSTLLLSAATTLLASSVLMGSSQTGPKHINSLLSYPALVWIGRRSYSWYLLHWPAMCLAKAYYLADVAETSLLAIGLATLLPAHMMYRWVEQPCRHASARRMDSARTLAISGLVMLALAVAFFVKGVRTAGVTLPPDWRAVMAQRDPSRVLCPESQRQQDDSLRSCASGSAAADRPSVYLWGDSHAGHLTPLVSKLATQDARRLVTSWRGGCPPIDAATAITGADTPHADNCTHRNAALLEQVLKDASATPGLTVILAARWEPYLLEPPLSAADRRIFLQQFRQSTSTDDDILRKMTELTRKMTLAGVQVIVVAPVPEQRRMVPECLRRFERSACEISRAAIDAYRASAMQLLIEVQKAVPGVQLIDPVDALCDLKVCGVGPADAPWYFDDDHLSIAGSERMTAALAKLMRLTPPDQSIVERNSRE